MEDKAQILKHGGPAKLALVLGYSVQRVSNWLRRGIPAREKLRRPDLFLMSPNSATRRQKNKN